VIHALYNLILFTHCRIENNSQNYNMLTITGYRTIIKEVTEMEKDIYFL